jgi:hypothetical protein
MATGNPYNLYTLCRNALTTLVAVKGCNKGTTWLYLENLSTTTKIQLVDPDLGRSSMKFMEIVCQAPSGVGSGDRRPGYLLLLGLACW